MLKNKYSVYLDSLGSSSLFKTTKEERVICCFSLRKDLYQKIKKYCEKSKIALSNLIKPSII